MKPRQVSFTITAREREFIEILAKRAAALALRHDIPYTVMDAQMDLTACHANGGRLDLAKLASADDANFGHDVLGIRRYLDRDTGALTQCFVPRCHERAADRDITGRQNKARK